MAKPCLAITLGNTAGVKSRKFFSYKKSLQDTVVSGDTIFFEYFNILD
jgi:hypothetical protein